VDLLRRNIDNPWQPPGGGATAALSHDVIHGLDVTEAPGLRGLRRGLGLIEELGPAVAEEVVDRVLDGRMRG
jgi:hypothetical protein